MLQIIAVVSSLIVAPFGMRMHIHVPPSPRMHRTLTRSGVPLLATTREIVKITKDTLAAQPGWAEGKGVAMGALSELIEEWESDDDDDAFNDAISVLEEAGWLRVEEMDDPMASDILFSTKVDKASSKPVATQGGLMKLVKLTRETLAAQPGWTAGKGVSIETLSENIEEWINDDYDDLFYEAIEILEEEGWLRIDEVDDEDASDMLYSTGRQQTNSEIVTLTRDTLAAQPGWAEGKGVDMETLSELIDAWASDDDDDLFNEAIDALEAEGWLRVEESGDEEKSDVLYNAAVIPKEEYDSAKEEQLLANLRAAVDGLDSYGINDDNERLRTLQQACFQLTSFRESETAPNLLQDKRFIGDWQLVATTSGMLAADKGLTGLGKAPFSDFSALFYSHLPDGRVIAKEVLKSLGNLVVNELRGSVALDSTGQLLQETYDVADMVGVKESPQFNGAKMTAKSVFISDDGLRVMTANGIFYVYKKLEDGELYEYLKERNLPINGGTIMGLSKEKMAEAYPYLKERNNTFIPPNKKGPFGLR